MPRFVILRHITPDDCDQPTHWDWMFELDESLATWSIDVLPISEVVHARRIADHRLAYLDYEGPVSRNRGVVSTIDRGEYAIVEWSDEVIELELAGKIWRGSARFQLARPPLWRLSFSQSRNESIRRVRP